MSNIAIIPARSGSKGLKDKNIKELSGKPLIAYSIECAQKSKVFDKIFVSTDSPRYAQIAEKFGADASFLRTEANSGDHAGSWDVVREVITHFEKDGVEFQNIMLLQPTSPLRNSEDVKNCFQKLQNKNANAIVSVTETDHSPLWCSRLDDDLNMDQFYKNKYLEMPRQLLPAYYRLNGAIYLVRREELDRKRMFEEKCYAYIMPKERSIDIDTDFDFKMAEYLISQYS